MDAPRLSKSASIIASVVLSAGFIGLVWERVAERRRPPAADASVALGGTVEGVLLETLDQLALPMDEVLDGHPALIVIASSQAPETCADYYLEFRVVRERWPHLKTIIVGSGPERDVFRAYFQERRLTATALLDPQRTLLSRLGVATTPLALLVDSSGRVLFTDARPPGRASQYPVGLVLRQLAAILGKPAS